MTSDNKCKTAIMALGAVFMLSSCVTIHRRQAPPPPPHHQHHHPKPKPKRHRHHHALLMMDEYEFNLLQGNCTMFNECLAMTDTASHDNTK